MNLRHIHIRCYKKHITEKELQSVWETGKKQGIYKKLFYDGTITTLENFITFAGEKNRAFYVIYSQTTPVALFWLDNRTAQAAFIHFALFKEAYGKKGRILGTYVLNWLLTSKDQSNRAFFKVLIGVTPITHTLAVRFLKDMGFTILGIIPHVLPLAEGKTTHAVVSYVTKGCSRLEFAQPCLNFFIKNFKNSKSF